MAKFKRFELVDFFKSLTELNLKGYNKFILFSVDRAKTTVREELKSYEAKEREIYTDEFVKFEQARVDTIRKYAVVEDGQYVEENGSYKIEEDKRPVLQEELALLVSEHKDLIDSVNAKMAELDVYMKDETDIPLTLVSFKHFPDAMDEKDYAVLSKFIKETPEEISNLMG
jgi:hypothetical protein